jgi:hypothetical protein
VHPGGKLVSVMKAIAGGDSALRHLTYQCFNSRDHGGS